MPAFSADHRRRIYFLETLSPTQPAALRTIAAFRQRLSEKTKESFDIFADYMELVRFPGQSHIDRTVQYLAGKYAEAPPDVLIALGRAAAPFLTAHRAALGLKAPVIIVSIPASDVPKMTDAPNDFFFVATDYNFARTLGLAQHLQPTAKNVVVIGGASDLDRQWLDDARHELQPFADRYTVRFIDDLPYEQILKEVAALPQNTIVIMSIMLADATGRPHVPLVAAEEIARASTAPVYGPVSTFLGRGIVGGPMDSWEEEGIAAADIALDILSGKNLAGIPRQTTAPETIKIDERQLRRWGLKQANLPADADIRFREFSIWSEYREQILAIIAVVVLQAAVISWLLVEHRRRRAAEANLRRRLMEVMHLNRTGIAGALSASVAHELNQPLAAIQAYAEAAEIYLKMNPPNIEMVQEILRDIRRDDQRAAGIITHLRGLLKKREDAELQEFDLGDTLRSALQVIRPEALKRGIELDDRLAAGSFLVRGDKVQVEQVVLNLAMNGLDAMQGRSGGGGTLSIETAFANGEEVEVSVADTGVGIAPDKLREVFETFYTTKRHGTGLGLAIARTIVEGCGGKIWAQNRSGGGAVFRFTLPLSKGAAA